MTLPVPDSIIGSVGGCPAPVRKERATQILVTVGPMLDTDPLKPAISELCRRLRVTRLDVFGSATTDDFGPDSDVDVLVRFERCGPGLFTRYFDLKEGLEAIFERPVDVIVEDALKNPYFKTAVNHTRKELYAA